MRPRQHKLKSVKETETEVEGTKKPKGETNPRVDAVKNEIQARSVHTP